jgi:DNA invertase Pin-like site-specific DNA recombinase
MGIMQTTLTSRSDPAELRAIVDLEAKGWTREEIMQLLGISRATYYNRKAEIRDIQESGPGADGRK